jgi:hypothetical protein
VIQWQRTGKYQRAQAEIRRVLEDSELSALLTPTDRTVWKDLRDPLARGPARRSLEEAFAPDQLERLTGPREFRMSWTFDHTHELGWKSGRWNPDSRGWSPLKAFANDEDLFAFDSSPRLELDPPIDVDSSLMVRLRLELLDPSSPSQTLVVTLAGVQFAFQVDRTVGHWRADTSSAQASLAALRTSGSRADSFPPFPEGRAFEVQLRVHARQARIEEILIDGRALDRPPLLSPAPDLRAPTLEVRAAERMRLLSVVLEGKQL